MSSSKQKIIPTCFTPPSPPPFWFRIVSVCPPPHCASCWGLPTTEYRGTGGRGGRPVRDPARPVQAGMALPMCTETWLAHHVFMCHGMGQAHCIGVSHGGGGGVVQSMETVQNFTANFPSARREYNGLFFATITCFLMRECPRKALVYYIQCMLHTVLVQ
jgi:hypothetical protein